MFTKNLKYNKQLNKDEKQLAFAPSSLILTNYYLPLSEALYSTTYLNIIFVVVLVFY